MSKRQQQDQLQPSSDNDSVEPTKIINLNDDCLIKISNYLDVSDLFNVSISNEKLRPAAVHVYKRNFSSTAVHISKCEYRPNVRAKDGHILKQEELHGLKHVWVSGLKSSLQYLRIFGSSISKIGIDYKNSKSKRFQHVHQYINQYCADTLTEINFEHKPNVAIDNFVKPFVNVKELQIWYSNFGEHLPSIVEWFPNVEQIELRQVTFDHRFIAPFRHFDHLKSFDVYSYPKNQNQPITMNVLLDMIKDNSSISKLFLDIPDINFANLRRLAKEHPSLIELDLRCQLSARNVIKLIGQLKALEALSFSYVNSYELELEMDLEIQLDDGWEFSVSAGCDLFEHMRLAMREMTLRHPLPTTDYIVLTRENGSSNESKRMEHLMRWLLRDAREAKRP